MVQTEPNVPLEARLGVMATCRALEIDRKTLQKKTEEGLIRVRFRKGTFKKFYLGRDIRRFWKAEA